MRTNMEKETSKVLLIFLEASLIDGPVKSINGSPYISFKRIADVMKEKVSGEILTGISKGKRYESKSIIFLSL